MILKIPRFKKRPAMFSKTLFKPEYVQIILSKPNLARETFSCSGRPELQKVFPYQSWSGQVDADGQKD